MADSPSLDKDFLTRLTTVVNANLGDEHFGVSELAAQMNMSRSNLLRKVKKETSLSVSQLISQARLKRAMELLREAKLNVSEVSHEVGFSSTSYFIKCFREFYGYPPGEVGKMATPAEQPAGEESHEVPVASSSKTEHRRSRWVLPSVIAAIIILLV